MEQYRVAGIGLLVVAGIAAIVAIISVYNVSLGNANVFDWSYAWGSVLATVVIGIWGFLFLKKATPAAPASPPQP